MAEWFPSADEKSMVVVLAGADEFGEVVSVLIALADDPQLDVVSTSDYSQLGVIVSNELHDRFVRYHQVSESSSPKEPKKKGAKS